MSYEKEEGFRGVILAGGLLCILWGSLLAQDQNLTETASVQFPNADLSEILTEYEILTGRRIVRDSAIQGVTLSVDTAGEMPVKEAARFIEKSLLLNGYALIPSGDDVWKIVEVSSKNPRSEGVPVLNDPSQLPESDEVVTYILPLEHLEPEAAAETFKEVYPPHSYGSIIPLPNASALLITENSAVLHRYLELVEEIDLPGSERTSRTFTLERADAEGILEALTDLLNLDETSEGSPVAVNPVSADVEEAAVTPGSGNSPRPRKAAPEIVAIPRTNSLLVVAHPEQMFWIEGLIRDLDAPRGSSHFMTWKLSYLPVFTFLEIAGDALLRGGAGDRASSISGGTALAGQELIGSGTGGRSTLGSGSSLSQRSTGSLGGGGRGQGPQDIGPQSLVVGKTLIIADNVHNTLLASGPPEQLELISELLAQLDSRPPQIQISTVIAQLTLGDQFDFGIDLLQTLDTGTVEDEAFIFRSRSGSILDIDTLDDVANFLPTSAGLTVYGQLTENLNTYVTALESRNRLKVLARPTVYTLNNRQARITTGQQVAVPRSTLTSLDPGVAQNQAVTASIEFVDVLLELDVVPLINADNEVTLQIYQTNNDIVGSQIIGGNEVPTIGTQELVTTVMVPDGSTILLGGLISEEERDARSGLPVFVGLPFVGQFFGTDTNQENRQELLIFLQPRIVRSEPDRIRAELDFESRSEASEDVREFMNAPAPEAEVRSVGAESAPVESGLLQRLFRRRNTE